MSGCTFIVSMLPEAAGRCLVIETLYMAVLFFCVPCSLKEFNSNYCSCCGFSSASQGIQRKVVLEWGQKNMFVTNKTRQRIIKRKMYANKPNSLTRKWKLKKTKPLEQKENARSDVLWAKTPRNVLDTSYLLPSRIEEAFQLTKCCTFEFFFSILFHNMIQWKCEQGKGLHTKLKIYEKSAGGDVPLSPKRDCDDITSPNGMDTRTRTEVR